MVCSNNKKIAKEVIKLKGQGLKITADKPYYWHDRIGYNYRMTNICAAIGYSQIKIIDDILKKKRIIFESYKKQLRDLGLSSRLLFFVTMNSNVNLLVRSIEIDLKELIGSPAGISIPFSSKFENNIKLINIGTRRFFDSYGLLINE
jgi:dTDP-4-amino-4,6-dideoxygalactose transaminase